jgi:hypothetical protein
MSNPAIDSAVPASSMVGLVLSTAILGLGLILPPGAAAQVYRCETADGRVTYTNGKCPANARRSRSVDDTPAVQVIGERPAASAAAGASDVGTKSDGEAPADAAKTEAKAGAKPSTTVRSVAAGATVSRAPAADLPPAQLMEQLDRERDRQRAVCDQLLRRIDFAYADLEAATSGQRASYELQLRRLQDEYLAQCALQR